MDQISSFLVQNPNKAFTYGQLEEVLKLAPKVVSNRCSRLTKIPNTLFEKFRGWDDQGNPTNCIYYNKRKFYNNEFSRTK